MVIGQDVKPYRETSLEFKVLSASLMSPEERRKEQSDNIDINVRVKLRLANCGTKPVYVFSAWKENTFPAGHTVLIGNPIRWFEGLQTTTAKSPGLQYLTKLTDGGHWLRLDRGTALEWEVFNSTYRGPGRYAETVFIKSDKKTIDVSEILSDSYELPK